MLVSALHQNLPQTILPTEILQSQTPKKKCRKGVACQFFKRDICAYNHNDFVAVATEENNSKIKDLEKELECLKHENKKLESENDELKNHIEIQTNEIKSIKAQSKILKRENYEFKKEILKAKKNAEILNAEILHEKKEKVTNLNLLQAANEKIDKVKDNLAKEEENHHLSRKTIAELEVKAIEAEQRLKKYSATIRILLKEEKNFKQH